MLKQLGECLYCFVFVDVRIAGNQFKIIKCDKNQSKNQSRFLGILGVPFGGLLGILWGSLGVVGGGLGSLSGPFGDPWDPLWAPVGLLGVCFADPWDPWGLLGRSRADFWFFWEIMGPLLAPFWHPFGTFFRLSRSVTFFIDV